MSVDSLQSLVSTYFGPQNTKAKYPSINMTVEKLDEMIEGYSTAFDEDSNVKVTVRVNPDFNEFYFDETFGNIAFKA
jgi:hypothetical protein